MKTWYKVMRVATAPAPKAADHKYGRSASKSMYSRLHVTGCSAYAVKLRYSQRKCTNGSPIGPCRIDISEHEGPMFRILINIHVCCRGRFSASATRKDAQSAHIQYTGKVRYIKSICGYFCEKCCVRSFMCYFWSQWHNAFYSTKVVAEKKNAALISCISCKLCPLRFRGCILQGTGCCLDSVFLSHITSYFIVLEVNDTFTASDFTRLIL